ncbi:Maltose permease MAL61 [Talaromyces islandicus]|uniref:Maltose permease MAL61 n=1 Tax=Talaromyces islandicus TaxID=28573 RepID=A0A0U1LUE4_TALIS|nr:Maltose permease MAL61 [Talaromyces islandicus]
MMKSNKQDTDFFPLADSERSKSFWIKFTENRRLCLWGIALASCSLVRGYETSFVGNISGEPAFKLMFGTPDPSGDGSYIIPTIWLSLWSASSAIGSLTGSLIGGWSQDAVGRKWTIGVAGVMQAVTVTISYLADQAATTNARGGIYFVGKVSQGMAMGAMMCTAQAYISEVLPPLIRGSVVSTLAPFAVLGQIIAALVIKSQEDIMEPIAYRLPMATQWIISAIPLVLVIFLPESPAWLMRKGRFHQAREACLKLEGPKMPDDGNNAYDRLRVDIARESEDGSKFNEISYLDLFRKRSDARRTMIVLFASTIPELFGLPLFGHTTYFAELLGMKAGQATTLYICGAVGGFLFSVLGFYLLTRVGRRRLLVFGLTPIALLWLAMGIAACFKSASIAWFVGVVMAINICIASAGPWPASYAVVGEASTLKLKAKTAGLAWFTNYLTGGVFSLFLPYIYNSDQGNLGGKIGLVYAGFTGFAAIACWLFVPEMKDRSHIELDEMFEAKLSTRKFRSYSGHAAVPEEEYPLRHVSS